MIASIADSTGHRSYVRARFVQLGGPGAGNVIAPIPVTPLRDFAHLDQGECAAFGSLQCGGVMLTQGIPGFVTRDRDLNLVLSDESARSARKLISDWMNPETSFEEMEMIAKSLGGA